ncbi:MAG: hypothetical protein ACI4NJ_10715 [Cellvibrio sp.]
MPNFLFALPCFAAYPITIHLALLLDKPQALIIAPLFFLLGIIGPALIQARLIAWLTLAIVVSILAIIDQLGLTQILLYLPPILFPCLAFTIFARSLVKGREPLITYIGEASRGPLSPAMRRYTRRLTQLWCVVLALLVIEGLVLPFIVAPTGWSWITNIINYALVGGLFIGEFWWRKYRFPGHNHPNFIDYLKIIASHPPPSYDRDSAVSH